MTNAITSSDLQQYRKIKREVRHLQELIAAESRIFFPRIPTLTGMPHGSGATDRLGEEVARYLDRLKQLSDKVADLQLTLTIIEDAVESLADADERDILRMRYMTGETWKEIAYKSALSVSTCKRIHNRALEHLR